MRWSSCILTLLRAPERTHTHDGQQVKGRGHSHGVVNTKKHQKTILHCISFAGIQHVLRACTRSGAWRCRKIFLEPRREGRVMAHIQTFCVAVTRATLRPARGGGRPWRRPGGTSFAQGGPENPVRGRGGTRALKLGASLAARRGLSHALLVRLVRRRLRPLRK